MAPPSISLPKGGGAIRGIGEKFSANPVTGTGSLTVPIALSPGRSGFGPRMSLSYDSGTGNGPFGIGCSLSLPSITRKTDKGLPKYHDHHHPDAGESDVFILSGSEDLVPVLRKDVRGKWVFDEFERGGYQVQRYRPRVEGLFARIERWTRHCDGDVHWRSITKDNILTVYGSNSESRIADPADPTRIFTWLICQSYDDKGNGIVYEYAAENDCGVDLHRTSERHRTHTANRYLKRIRYGNRRPLLLDVDRPDFRKSHIEPLELEKAGWMFEAVFDYGDVDYCEEPPDERDRVFVQASARQRHDAHWPARQDPFSSYRSRFEVRTHRLCRRVLMFHHFPDELGEGQYLVRSTEFEYRQKPLGSFVRQVVQSGYRRISGERYLKKSLPALELTFTSSPLENPGFDGYQVKEVDASSLANLPSGIDGQSYRWIDLNGEGISGVLSEQAGAWFYKPNLGGGHFGPVQTVARRPSLAALNSGRQQLLDLAGEGKLDLAEFGSSTPGFYDRDLDQGWQGFRAFQRLPNRDWNDPNLRFVDVTGDGIADVLITEDEALAWHPSLEKEGFGPAVRVPIPHEEETGPLVVFADGTQSIYLADMTGDGLSDIVRIRNGEVCYWPNLGYGGFGAKVTMDDAPWFEHDDLLDQKRIRLTDTDGSGTTDILYVGHDGIHVYLNEAGNSWSAGRVFRQFPATDDHASISVVDFLGRGTACLLWSTPLPRDSERPLRYIDLMCGQKPHLLTRVRNNLGAETVVEYASSTEFYLADQAAGTPWITRLAFPVHVVKRVEIYDFISRNRFVTSYSYHHGYFDGVEREFRGFGRVEQLDTEEFATLSGSSVFPQGANIDAASSVPPVLSKSWFHTGAFLEGRRISRQFEHEYYREGELRRGESELDPDRIDAMQLEDTVLPERFSPAEAREACRSLKGSMLRREVYALDEREESRRPYTVTENNFTIRPLQPRKLNRHAAFFTHARESVSFSYERKLYDVEGCRRADPRVTHQVTLRVDDYGNVLEAVSIGYGRRFADHSPLLTAEDRVKQSQILISLTRNRHTNAVQGPDAYRAPRLAEVRSYELVKLKPESHRFGITNFFRFHELEARVAQASDGLHDLPYEDTHAAGATAESPYRRLIQRACMLYRGNTLDRLLPLGDLESLALPGAGYRLAFTPGLPKDIYRRPEAGQTENLLPDPSAVLGNEGGYVDLDGDGHWWIPAGKVYYSPEANATPAGELAFTQLHFFLPHRFQDPFGNISVVVYDRHDLSVRETRDPVGNTTRAEIDYRVLVPWLVTDANGNRSEVAVDALGMVAGTAVMGKENESLGDSLEGFVADLDESAILAHVGDPLRAPHKLLERATTRLVYDLFAFQRTRSHSQPRAPVVYILARETHDSDLAPGQQTRIQHAFSYSDGFAREIQKKLQAEPGPLVEHGPRVNPRWVGSGWTIFNNKGKPVRQYEPFFSPTQEFEFAKIVGVSPILIYDPVERVVATLHPNHTFEKVVFDSWRQQTWDVNDSVLQRNPADDPDVGGSIQRLQGSDYLPAWYEQRETGGLGPAERAAAAKAAVHANTPASAYLDSLGRSFVMIAHNRFVREDSVIEEHFATRTEFDIQGNQLSVIDALNRRIMSYDYDMINTRIHQNSADAGRRWMLNDVLGKPLRTWDSRQHEFQYQYDALRRPTDLLVRTGQGDAKLVERAVYGEGRAGDLALNLRTRMFQQFEGAGVITSHRYDFKGNLLSNSRQLLVHYREPEVNWLDEPPLETETFTSSVTYDALNRTVTSTTPDASTIRPQYNEASLLERLDINLRGAGTTTPFVLELNYNAKRQREFISYGNGARTHYNYDPLTFRLVNLKTTRTEDHVLLQDLSYTYDPVGNVTAIHDAAQENVYFRNQVLSASNSYVCDAVYRLIGAEGREHIGQHSAPQTTFDDSPRMDQPLPGDGHAMRKYREHYHYDEVGNILKVSHEAANGSWTRHYAYDEPHSRPANNRLTSTHVGELDEHYTYDSHGNMTRMPHLPGMEWDVKDHLHATRRQVVKERPGLRTYFVYSSAGQRIRKVTVLPDGSKAQERIYLEGIEFYREYSSDGEIKLERASLHVTDDKRRIALIETKTIDSQAAESQLPGTLVRYQFSNHLDSSTLELDESAATISYEEYYPFGSTSYESVRKGVEVSQKRYRYIDKERDEETGFYYHGARYCAPWLGRWTSCDPAEMADGPNLYAYARNNPISLRDPHGTDSQTCQAEEAAPVCMADPSALTPREQAEQKSIPSEHPEASSLPPPAAVREYDGPSASAVTDEEWAAGTRNRIMNLDLPPEQLLPGYEAIAFSGLYYIAYGIKQSIYRPIKSLVLDERPQYLDSGGHVRTWQGPVDHTDAFVAFAQIGMLAIPGAGEAGLVREAGATGDIALGTASSRNLLMVGAETPDEFTWLSTQGQSGWNTAAVNPLRTPAATAFESGGGRFIHGGVEDVGEAFNWTHESFPQPLGRTVSALDAYQARLGTLAPGGRLTILTEDQGLINMYRAITTTPNAPYTFSESLFTAAHPQAGLLPPATSTYVAPGANTWLIDILRHQ